MRTKITDFLTNNPKERKRPSIWKFKRGDRVLVEVGLLQQIGVVSFRNLGRNKKPIYLIQHEENGEIRRNYRLEHQLTWLPS